MKSQEIKSLVIDSSKTYHNFLSETGRGIEEVKVISITQSKNKFKLILNKKIYNLEAIEFWVSGKQINSDKIKIIVYDNDTNTLIIKPEPELHDQFNKIYADEIKIVSDLKFLVRNVKDWYEKNGEYLKLPNTSPSLIPPTSEQFLSDMLPSTDQKTGIDSIFNNPLSYIWGAPGTGKTQLVLAYSLIHYIRAGKKVVIFAATNNALEQILLGVFEMTSKAGIEDSNILRLGTPSNKFAQAHPDSCEMIGVQQKIGEVDNQIKIVKDIINHNQEYCTLETIKHESDNIFTKLDGVQGSREEMTPAIKLIEKDIYHEQFTLNKLQLQILELEKSIRNKEKTVNSFFYVLKKKLTKNTDLEITLKKEKIELQTKVSESEVWVDKVQEYKNKLDEMKKVYNDTSQAINLIENLKKLCVEDSIIKDIVSSVTFKNYKSIKANLNAELQKRSDLLAPTEMIAPEYSNLTRQELEQKLQSFKEQKSYFESETEDRIKDANVIALTLDCYISRYKDKDLHGEHYFLDEAGYASLVKALTLFKGNIPITFLGDHMQLPPVCEMNDRDIDENGKRGVFVWTQSALYAEWMFSKEKEDAFLDYIKNSPFVFDITNKTDLKQTYRFGSSLTYTLNEFVYKNGFIAHQQNGTTEIYYVHAPHTYPQSFNSSNGRSSPSRENPFEVSKIIELYEKLDKENFAILTPYKKQVSLLGEALPNARRDQRIMTVHGSQGKEWNDVILSVVDTDRMWFVDTLNRNSRGMNILNTAVSRAKKRLFIVCNYNFWITQDEQLLKGLLDVAKEVK